MIVAAAIIGDNVGYTIGKHSGKRIFRKRDGLFFRQEYIARAETFYERHGGKTIILARFVPIIRTFAPVVAGVGHMPRRRFMMFNVVGAITWGVGVTLLGYFLGSKIPDIDAYIQPVIIGATIVTFSPTLYHVGKDLLMRAAKKGKYTRVVDRSEE